MDKYIHVTPPRKWKDSKLGCQLLIELRRFMENLGNACFFVRWNEMKDFVAK